MQRMQQVLVGIMVGLMVLIGGQSLAAAASHQARTSHVLVAKKKHHGYSKHRHHTRRFFHKRHRHRRHHQGWRRPYRYGFRFRGYPFGYYRHFRH